MKRIVLLMALAVMALGTTARVVTNPRPVGQHNNNRIVGKDTKTRLEKRTRLDALRDRPDGEFKAFKRSGRAIYATSEGITMGYQTGNMNVVFADDGKVYIENILYGTGNYFGTNWVEGTLSTDGTEIVVPMGQSIYWSEDYGADVVLVWGTTSTQYNDYDVAQFVFDVDEGVDHVVYTIDGDYIDGPCGDGPVYDPDNDFWNYCATGLTCQWTDDCSFGGFMEWETAFTLTEATTDDPQVIYEQPDGELIVLDRTGDCIYRGYFGIGMGGQSGRMSLVLTDDGKCYLQNPLWYLDSRNTWVEGTWDSQTGIISIPTGQYLTWNSDYGYGIQLVWGTSRVIEEMVDGEAQYSLKCDVDHSVSCIRFQFDGENLILLDSEGDVDADYPRNFEATGMMGVYSDDGSWTALEFNTQGIKFAMPDGPAIPCNPDYIIWNDNGSSDGYSYLEFSLPYYDLDGNPLYDEFLSYSVYTDGDIFVFDAMTYSYDLTDDLTEIPYSVWSNSYDFHRDKVYIYRTNMSWNDEERFFWNTVGIQAIYTVNGVKYASDIVWYSNGGGGVTGVDEMSQGKTVASVRYYTPTGQEIEKPAGLTIQMTTYSDGTTVATKVLK